MCRIGRMLIFGIAVALAWMAPVGVWADDVLTGMVIGRTGEVMHVSLPQPVREGCIIKVKPMEREPAIAELRVLSCTKERPYVALAKVVRCDMNAPIATGVHAYADAGAVSGPDVPKPMRGGQGLNNGDRFSIQAGTFRPNSASLRESTTDYWQAYRVNYSLLKVQGFETQLSAEYAKGIGSVASDAGITRHTMEVIPMTVIGKIRPFRMGGMHMFLGAGAGMYQIRTKEDNGSISTSNSQRKFGKEFSAGFEHKRGWVLELRYRDVQDTEIRGYSLAAGGRF